jgi:hypothetical protein
MPRQKKDHEDPPYKGAIGREIGERLIRCFHTDANRPPHEHDDYEFHWRCTAAFQCAADQLPYCPYHLPIYTHTDGTTEDEARLAAARARKAKLKAQLSTGEGHA